MNYKSQRLNLSIQVIMGHFQIHFIILVMFYFNNSEQLLDHSLLPPNVDSDPHPFLCHPDQSLALLQFKSNFVINASASSELCGSYSLPRTESWKEGTDCCSSWNGVTCDVFTGHVIRLHLFCSQLQGTILSNNTLFSSHIAPYLQRLRLDFNDFQGSNISPQFGLNFPSLTRLDLSSSNFRGNIPSQISHLSNLRELGISSKEGGLKFESNSVFKSIALNLTHLTDMYFEDIDMSSEHDFSSLMNLSSLEFLRITNCKLRGKFPESVLLLPNLDFLDLSHNNFDPVTSLPNFNFTALSNNLKYLDLSDCNLRVPIHSSLFAMPSLTSVFLSNNMLHGDIQRSVFQSENLTTLDLSNNSLSGSVDFDVFSNLKNLIDLTLSNNNLSSHTNTNLSFTSFPSLVHLDLSSCNLTEFPAFMKALTNLTFLDVSNNQIQGPIPKWMFDGGKHTLSAIYYLDFGSNLLQGPLPIPPSTTGFFSVSNNKLVGDISSQFCDLSILQVLDLSHNNLTGLIPQCLGNSSALSVLNLRMNRLHGTIPNSFAKVMNILNYLDLHGNRLRGPLPQSLKHCQNLQVLDLGNNMIEEIFPHWLEALSSLEVLALRSNKFFGSLDNFNAKFFFSKLRILDLSNNSFIGQLPVRLINNLDAMMSEGHESRNRYMLASNVSSVNNYYSMVITVKGVEMEYVKILTTLATLDLSCNKFEGGIPNVIGKLRSLKGLNLSQNFLSGHIPSTMGDLTNLEWLDLSSNKLRGHIPRQLADLTFLAVINLSHNLLYGPITQGKQFNTFDNSSFDDNLGCQKVAGQIINYHHQAMRRKILRMPQFGLIGKVRM